MFLFFFNDTATTEIYTLSLHDALPISRCRCDMRKRPQLGAAHPGALLHALVVPPHGPEDHPELRKHLQHAGIGDGMLGFQDRKSTRLNSSHLVISYAVFCLKKTTTSTRVRSGFAPKKIFSRPATPYGARSRSQPSGDDSAVRTPHVIRACRYTFQLLCPPLP